MYQIFSDTYIYLYYLYTCIYNTSIYLLLGSTQIPPSSFLIIGTLRSDDGDGNENGKKAIRLISKTTTSHVHHAFLYISQPSLHDYNVKMPNFKFFRGRKQATTKFSFSFLACTRLLRIQLQESTRTFDKVSEMG